MMILRFKHGLFCLAAITVLQSTAWSQIKTDGSPVDTGAKTTPETPISVSVIVELLCPILLFRWSISLLSRTQLV